MNYYRFFITSLLQGIFFLLCITHVIIFVDTQIVQRLMKSYCSAEAGTINLGSNCIGLIGNVSAAEMINSSLDGISDYYAFGGIVPDDDGTESNPDHFGVKIVELVKDIVFSPLTGLLFALVLIRKYLKSEELLTKFIMVTLLSVFMTVEIFLSSGWFSDTFNSWF